MEFSIHALTGFLGRLHPALVHFPIALLAVAAFFEGVQVWRRSSLPSPATPLLSTAAAMGATTSTGLGLLLKLYEAAEGSLVALHGWLGLCATVMALAAAASFMASRAHPRAVWCGRVALAAGAGFVLGAGFLGGEMVFGRNHLLAVFQPKPTAGLGERAQGQKVDFGREIAPILKVSCLKCHGPDKQKGHLRLDRQEDALRGGEDGPVIVPGDRSRSRLFELLKEKDPGTRMPSRADPLPAPQIELIGRWIDEGAHWPKDFVVR